ncbi:MAG: alpha/beta fold hydrolase, partial [Pseudomonadota bacterium]
MDAQSGEATCKQLPISDYGSHIERVKMKIKFSSLATAVVVLLLVLTAGCSSFQDDKRERASTDSADGSTIAYGVRGDGSTTLVFIHCWTCNHEFWNPQIEYFSKTHQVVWLDLAGHGLSSGNRHNYTMTAFGEDVAAVVNKIDA